MERLRPTLEAMCNGWFSFCKLRSHTCGICLLLGCVNADLTGDPVPGLISKAKLVRW